MFNDSIGNLSHQTDPLADPPIVASGAPSLTFLDHIIRRRMQWRKTKFRPRFINAFLRFIVIVFYVPRGRRF